MGNANLFPKLFQIMKTEKNEIDISKEAMWAISNATNAGSPQQVRFLVDQGVIPALCFLLKGCHDRKTLAIALEGLENILRKGIIVQEHSESNRFTNIVEECGGVDCLKELRSEASVNGLSEKAADINGLRGKVTFELPDF